MLFVSCLNSLSLISWIGSPKWEASGRVQHLRFWLLWRYIHAFQISLISHISDAFQSYLRYCLLHRNICHPLLLALEAQRVQDPLSCVSLSVWDQLLTFSFRPQDISLENAILSIIAALLVNLFTVGLLFSIVHCKYCMIADVLYHSYSVIC